MILSLARNDLKRYFFHQLDTFFPDGIKAEGKDTDAAIALALDRLEYCFKHIAVPAYSNDSQTFFNHLHGDQYSQFLYYCSNSLWAISENRNVCDKIVQLNRMLSGCFWTYHSGLPAIFYWSHPVGTVLGKANYGNYFSCRHNCTIATQNDLNRKMGEYLFMGAGSALLGKKLIIGNRVAIGAGTCVFSENSFEDDTLVISQAGKIIKKKREKEEHIGYMNIFK